MLELKDLRAAYGDHEVLHGLSYSFKDGKNYCLLGPNGCGKTTLLRAIAALIPFSGSVTVDGQELVTKKRIEIAREVALLSQVSHVYFPYTVWDTVMLGRYQHIRSRQFPTAKLDVRRPHAYVDTSVIPRQVASLFQLIHGDIRTKQGMVHDIGDVLNRNDPLHNECTSFCH